MPPSTEALTPEVIRRWQRQNSLSMGESKELGVAAGTAVTGRPPPRSARALLTHMAPTSDAWRRSVARDKNEERMVVVTTG